MDTYLQEELKMRELRRQGYTYAIRLANGDYCPGYHHSMIEMILDLLERASKRIDRAGG